ncbi:hypothetical protein M2133_002419 [Parabacteroides sp. PF5-6]|nr:hypothetical protein [Parabacteroides sp. PF5-6]
MQNRGKPITQNSFSFFYLHHTAGIGNNVKPITMGTLQQEPESYLQEFYCFFWLPRIAIGLIYRNMQKSCMM